MKKWQRYTLIGSVSALSVLFQYTELGINLTKSFPYKYFLIVKDLSFQNGDLISIKGHHAKYIGDLSLIKRVVGVSGDPIEPLLVNLKKTTKCGKPLNALSLTVIPDGYVFVNADHKDSYDSRYKEFGLVSVDHIKGRAFILGGKV